MRVNPEAVKRQMQKAFVAISILIPVALLHFFTGRAYKGPYPEFVNGYLLDILVPSALYFLLCPYDAVFSFLRPWFVKGLPVFAVGFSVEVAQFYGVPIFGRTFDPLDFVMYGVGVVLAAVLDTTVFPRLFEFWTPKTIGPRGVGVSTDVSVQ